MLRLVLVVLLLGGLGCGQPSVPSEPASTPAPSAPPELVSAHTEGVVPRGSAVRVRFVDRVPGATPGEEAPGLFSFDPPLKGTATWASDQEVSFQPAEPLGPGTAYRVRVDLGEADPTWVGQTFGFDFGVIPPSFRTELLGLVSEPGALRFDGVLHTGDAAEAAAVEAALKATQGETARTVSWTHEADSRTHQFSVAGIERGAQESELVLDFDGASLGVEREQQERIAVPGATFTLASVRPVITGERAIELHFSDPVDPHQQLAGLVAVEGRDDVRLDVDGSIVLVHARGPWNAQEVLVVTGVRDSEGRQLEGTLRRPVSFEPMKPAARFSGGGVLIPRSAGMQVPIEVANLRSVVVQADRVFSSNIPQFLQVNGWEDGEELRRVGRTVWRERVPIEGAEDNENRWVHLALDLTDLVKEHPDGLYRLTLRFDRGDILYRCPEDLPERPDRPEPTLVGDWEDEDGDSSYWDFWDTASGGGLPWWEMEEHREDPCHPGYYRTWWDHDITASRNVMMTNLGLIAKQGEDGRVVTAITDLRTTEPVAGAEITLLDYQLQPLSTATSDEEGMAILPAADKPFLVEAHWGGDSAFLKLDRGGALSVAHFDVSGQAVQRGLKGFLYGERGVWRPGDRMFLDFVLFDEDGALPAEQPVHFSLKDPLGRVIERRAVTGGMDGFFDLEVQLPDDAPTGGYLATVQVGGATFTRNLRVETIIPNRLKIDLPLPSEPLQGARPTLETTLTSRWLHGAVAGKLDYSLELELKGATTSFPQWEGYTFDDATASVDSSPFVLDEGLLDEEGVARIAAPIDVPKGAPGMLRAILRTRVMEPGGHASVDEGTLMISPHERYVGIKTPKGDAARGMLLTDTKHPIELVTVDAKGQATGSGTVDVVLYKVSWRWWWEKGSETFADYAGTSDHAPIASGEVAMVDGRGTWELEVKYPEWGRYLLVATDRDGTHRSTRTLYLDWPGWAGRGQKENPGGASVLTLTASSQEVTVGEEVTIQVPTPAGGRALVSLEDGARVLSTAWLIPTGDTTPYRFTATAAMAPNVYAHVTLLQPHGENGNDRPLRLDGVLPVAVVDPATKLQPVIEAAAVLEPESKTTVRVSEEAGRAMTYTLAVVDEGLLGLTRYATPDPWEHFYAREALGVRSWDLYDQVMGGYGGAIEGLLAIGGDGSEGPPPVAKANRFPPMVRHLGPFRLEPGQVAEHRVDVPSYLGEVRIMVVAGHDGAFGHAEQSVPVRKPLMALATLPRVLSVGEAVRLPVSVFATDPSVTEATVSVRVSGAAALDGAPSTRVTFPRPGDQMVALGLKAGDTPGPARIEVNVSGGGETTQQVIELDVRYPAPPVVDMQGGVIPPGQSWAGVPTLTSGTATLELSRVPPLDLERRLDALITYPHGCVEQTTSAAFPQLALGDLLELSPERAAQVSANVGEAIRRLRGFQTPSGGFATWAGSGRPDPWSTSYVGQFLLEAERAGYIVPQDMRSRWLSWQQDTTNRWIHEDDRSDLQQAYRLYGLALAGRAPVGAMNRLRGIDLGPAARWRLAAAYTLIGQPEAAAELVADAAERVPGYRESGGGTFGSGLRDGAMILDAEVLMGRDAHVLAEEISAALVSERWLSTQEAAQALVALAHYAGGDGEPWSVSWVSDGAPHEATSTHPMLEAPLTLRTALTVQNPGDRPLYLRLVERGLPPLNATGASSHGLALGVRWGNEAVPNMDPGTIPQGTDFSAIITVNNPGSTRLEQLALTSILPSGWETWGEAAGPGEGYTYRDVRDDRVMTYFDLDAGEERTFEVRLHAAYLGHFYLPPVVVEAMYDGRIGARTAGRWIEVVPAGAGS